MVNGAGAAAIACTELIKAMGVPHDNVIMCDRKGVIYQGREGLDQWKSAHAAKTDARTLEEALKGADVFLGLSAAGALKPEMVKDDGHAADHLRDGQSRSRDHPARRQGGAARRDRRHRPLGLSEPGQQRARLPVHLPRRARRAGDDDQRGDEDRRRPRARRARPPAGARGSRRGLWRQGAQLRPRLHHPRAVRSAADGGRPRRGRPGGDG